MKAAYIENGQVHVGTMPDPVPAKGQALVRTHSCGLCASDVHFLSGGQNIIDLSRRLGGPYAALDFARYARQRTVEITRQGHAPCRLGLKLPDNIPGQATPA